MVVLERGKLPPARAPRVRTARPVFQAVSRAPVPNPVETVVAVDLPEVYAARSGAGPGNGAAGRR
ncbi:hypothetical protein GCM10010272_30860 [Streptomyces lateritius]|nr:hypothetical protein GCM10010272_30860 [Streptomyces lateritius]